MSRESESLSPINQPDAQSAQSLLAATNNPVGVLGELEIPGAQLAARNDAVHALHGDDMTIVRFEMLSPRLELGDTSRVIDSSVARVLGVLLLKDPEPQNPRMILEELMDRFHLKPNSAQHIRTLGLVVLRNLKIDGKAPMVESSRQAVTLRTDIAFLPIVNQRLHLASPPKKSPSPPAPTRPALRIVRPPTGPKLHYSEHANGQRFVIFRDRRVRMQKPNDMMNMRYELQPPEQNPGQTSLQFQPELAEDATGQGFFKILMPTVEVPDRTAEEIEMSTISPDQIELVFPPHPPELVRERAYSSAFRYIFEGGVRPQVTTKESFEGFQHALKEIGGYMSPNTSNPFVKAAVNDKDELPEDIRARMKAFGEGIHGIADKKTTGGRTTIPLLGEPLGDWADDALCSSGTGEHSKLFYSEFPSDIQQAKRICADCTVQADCLSYALRTDQNFGVWGGINFSGSKAEAAAVRRAYHKMKQEQSTSERG